MGGTLWANGALVILLGRLAPQLARPSASSAAQGQVSLGAASACILQDSASGLGLRVIPPPGPSRRPSAATLLSAPTAHCGRLLQLGTCAVLRHFVSGLFALDFELFALLEEFVCG